MVELMVRSAKNIFTQQAFNCAKSAIETPGKDEKVCSKLTIKTPERRELHRSGALIVNFEHFSHRFLVFLLLTLNKYMPAAYENTYLFRQDNLLILT